MDSSDSRSALSSLYGCIQNTFKKFDRNSRRKAWNSITHGKGKDEVEKLLNNPSHQVVGIPRLLRFKEWLKLNEI